MTPKQQRFVEEYLVDLNATQAAIRAGYSAKGATVRGSELLANRNVANAISAGQKSRSKRLEIDADRVVQEFAKVGFANAGDYFDWGPDGITVRSKDDLTPEQQAAVAEVSETTTEHGGTIRVKLHNKLDALEKLGRHLGLFKDAPPVSVNVNLPTDQSSFSERLAARRKERALAKKKQLH